MWILSQNKKLLMNLNILYISKANTGHYLLLGGMGNNIEENHEELGRFQNEDAAIAELNTIVKLMRDPYPYIMSNIGSVVTDTAEGE